MTTRQRAAKTVAAPEPNHPRQPNELKLTKRDEAALRHLAKFPLVEALFGRRSRRFFRGAEVPDGPLAYKSRHEPLALSELERLLVLMSVSGNTGWHTGAKALAVAKDAQGAGAVALGNLLADPGVPAAMVAAFAAAKGETLAERLVRGLEAGKRAGGETGPERSAALLVSTGLVWPVVDLRVDWHDAPIQELRRFWELYRPQQAAYEARAANPGAAPGF